jgi:hypothetical protein
MVRSLRIAFWLDAIPGLLGFFGVGEVYLGHIRRGEAFLVWTAALYVSVLVSFAFPGLSHYWSYLPVAWGAGYLLLLVDIFRVTRMRR